MAIQSLPFSVSTGQYALRIFYTQIGKEWYPEYICEADPCDQGKIHQPVWRIRKVSYDDNGNVITVLYANADKRFKFRCTQRASYTYA